MSTAIQIRQAIISALPVNTAEPGGEVNRKNVYTPPGHLKALNLDCSLVIGGRGVGKSFWTGVLTSKEARTTIPGLNNIQVGVGFTTDTKISDYPDPDTFVDLLKYSDPYDIWRAIIGRWLARLTVHQVHNLPQNSWKETVDWCKSNPEALAALLEEAGKTLASHDKKGLIIFDALDRTCHDWDSMDQALRGLMRAVLWLKRHPRLHAKIFLREDQFDRALTSFPDASKILNTKQELIWAAHDLHGMLWQRLCNASGNDGDCLRALFSQITRTSLSEDEGVWLLPESVKRETTTQKALFERLAGPWMGKDRRRGVPYTWVVGHLADGNGRVSPRSFIAGIRAAGEESQERYHSHEFALHYEGIKAGIQAASQIRVDHEIGEEYGWIPKIMLPLQGLTVPCEFPVIEALWQKAHPGGIISVHPGNLPPQAKDWGECLNELKRLGIFETMRDNRINLPDLYRVGFRMGRRGGVKPVR